MNERVLLEQSARGSKDQLDRIKQYNAKGGFTCLREGEPILRAEGGRKQEKVAKKL